MDRPEREKHVLRVNKLYIAREIAKILAVSTDYINKLAKSGGIPSVSLNGHRMYCGWHIRVWLAEKAQGLRAKQNDGLEAG